MAKQYYRIEIDVTSTSWETCSTYVEAESEEEAREKFDKNPDDYEWDDWEIHDSEIRGWTVENIEYDKWMTNRMKETKDDTSM